MSEIQKFGPGLVTPIASPGTIGTLDLFNNVDLLGQNINTFQVSLDVTVTGTTGSPTLDVALQTSPDNFKTSGLITTILSMTQRTTTGSEVKSVKVGMQPGGTLIPLGEHRRLLITAISASGDKAFQVNQLDVSMSYT